MSWQKRYIQVILGLPLSLPLIADAVTVGDTHVKSQQNQPLQASISVTDIDPATFSVKLASSVVYQQMGLSDDKSISISFQPTGKNSGTILLTTTQPIHAPFTDVVLDIQDKDEQRLIPKTLLVPIDESQKVSNNFVETQPTTVTVGQNQQVELPVTGKTLDVNYAEPPPLEEAPTETVTQAEVTQPQVTEPVVPTLTEAQIESNNIITPVTPEVSVVKEQPEEDKAELTAQQPETVTPEVPAVTTENNTISEAVTAEQTSEPETAKSEATTQDEPETKAEVTETDNKEKEQVAGETIVYTIQRNDNLWTIASQIAKKNKTDVKTIMQEIADRNPDAFVDGDVSKIMVNTTLNIPKYEVMPSQLGIKAVKQAQQQEKRSSSKSKSSKPVTTQAKSTTKQSGKTNYSATHKAKTRTHIQPQQKARMTIVAPNQSKGSAQGATPNQNRTKGGTSPALMAQVQQKRQNTASQATRVNSLSSQLISAEQKIKLQNARLAQLEQRLKELNKK